jgi:hypothetical protein
MASDDPLTTASQADQSQELIRLLNQKLDALSGPIGQAQAQQAVAWFDYQVNLMKYNKALLDWQLLASNILLWVVVVMAAAGVIYSGVQLTSAARTTNLEISAQRIRLTTSIVGILVLIITLVFLLIFAQEVYQIKAVDLQPRS